MFVSFCSCKPDIFSPDSKEIAGGYRLKQVDGSHGYALNRPQQEGGRIIDEIGWLEPLIIFRDTGSDRWDIIDTSHATHVQVTDLQRRSDPVYRSIPVEAADKAWSRLSRNKPAW